MKKLKEILSYSINITDDIHLDVKTILFVILVFFFTALFLKLFKKIVNRKLDEENKLSDEVIINAMLETLNIMM